MRAVEFVVAIRHDDQYGERLDPSHEEAQHIEGGLVGPVHVLQHEDGRPTFGELLGQRCCDVERDRVALHELTKLRASLLRDVDYRSERPWREQRVACAPEEPRAAGMSLAEVSDEGGLAAASLGCDDDEAATSIEHQCIRRFEPVQERVSLEQVELGRHRGMHSYILLRRRQVLKHAGARIATERNAKERAHGRDRD